MGWEPWEHYPPSVPRRVANGIRAKTQRGAFGKTWWAGRWIAALERLVNAGRLTRGRSYARSGQVVELEAGPEGIQARVQGSRPQPYRVSIHFATLSAEAWERVIDAMAAEAIYAARLLAGEMPEQVEDVFEQAGVSLFPKARGDLQSECSCPDWANPCKHVAAVHYLLGERFDEDPFLMFLLRGRSKDDILAALRARRAAAAGGQVGEAATEWADGGRDDVETLATFWTMPADVAEMAALTWPDPPAVDALPVKRLGPPPFGIDAEHFTAEMEAAYRAIATEARRLLLGEDQSA